MAKYPDPTTERIWARSDRYTHGGNSREWLVVHNTANTASAKNEALNLKNNYAESSFHYVIDDTSIIQCVHDYDTAWAVGPWKGATAIIRNNQSISIEVCSNGTEFTAKEVENLRKLVLHLMEYYGISADHVVRHYDCHTGHKACPAAYCGSAAKDAKWEKLHASITTSSENGGSVKEVKDGVYRLYNGNSGLHHHTASHDEAEQLVRAGWSYEGCTFTTHAGTTVYRLYNENDGNHLETASVAEVGSLVIAGWTYEGVAWSSDKAGSKRIHRAYNPNNGDHLLLDPGTELDSLVKAGWVDEGEVFTG